MAIASLLGPLAAPACGDRYGPPSDDLSAYRSDRPEYGLVEGPDGRYLTRQDGRWGASGRQKILRFPGATARSQTPSWADASADESDFYYSRARRSACFTSTRAAAAGDRGLDIWCLDWTPEGWSEPSRLPAPVNSDAGEYSPVLLPSGEILFASDREGGEGLGDLYAARPGPAGWSVENLGPAVNSAGGEWNLEVHPGGDLLLFESSHRPANRSVPGDLYASRRVAGAWTHAVPLSLLNTDGSDLLPRFLDDARFTMASSAGPDVDLRIAALGDAAITEPVVAAVSRSTGDILLLHPDSLRTIGRIAAGRGPHDIAASEDGRIAVVPLHGVYPKPHDDPIAPNQLEWLTEVSDGVAVIDLVTGTSHGLHALANCKRPHGAAATAQANVAWITCESEGDIREIDPLSGKTLRIFATARGVHKLLYLDRRRLLAAGNPETGDLYLIDLDDGVVETLSSGKGAEALAANAGQDRIYVANSFDGTVCAFDLNAGNEKICRATGGSFPIAVAADAAKGLLWIANNASANLVALAEGSDEPVRTVALPSRPLGLAFDARQRRLYVGLPRLNAILLIDADSGKVLARSDDVMEVDDIDLIPVARFDHAPDT